MAKPSHLAALNYASPPFANWPIKQITSTYALQPSDNGYILNCTAGTFSINLVPATSFPTGFCCWVWNTSNTATDVITLQGNASQPIDATSSIAVRKSSGTQIIFDGVRWQVGARTTMRGYSENINNNSAYAAATNSGAMALGQGATGSGSFSTAIGFETIASANNSFAAGVNSGAGGSVAATGSAAMALGGSRAAGTDSLAAAVANNTSTYGAKGTNSIAIGQFANAAATNSVAFGKFASATGTGAMAVGPAGTATGYGALASGENSVAVGDGAVSSIYGKYAYSQRGFGLPADCQYGVFNLLAPTTNATATLLSTDRSAAGSTNQVILPNNSAYAFTGTVVARRQAAGGTESAAWKIEGLIRREGTAASTTLVASTVTAISNAPGWTLALSADTTNGGLAITATGAAATNIRWVATVQTSEVTYA